MSLPSDGMSSSSASGQLMTRFSVGVVCLSGGPSIPLLALLNQQEPANFINLMYLFFSMFYIIVIWGEP